MLYMMNSLYAGHYLMGCRFDNWIRLLCKNHWRIDRGRRAEALLITGCSLLLSPFALIESLLFDRTIRRTPLKDDPVFILGHWRSGTTFLQNLLSRDPQFGWSDPVSTSTMPNRLLLGRILAPMIAKRLRGARPMDNLQYGLDLPIEETFALLTISDRSLLHLIAFPENYPHYVAQTFVADFPAKELRAWQRDYDFVLRKLSYVNKGRRLLLKSPDNTAHLKTLLDMYPQAKFINIHRDPYVTIRSTIHMFLKQMELMRLSPLPDDLDNQMENVIVGIFERMYREMFALEKYIPKNRFVELAYTDFVAAPVEHIRRIYTQLELPGFEAARPLFETYAASQENYVKNQFTISPRLRAKINARLGFYFERYGYEMREEQNP